MAMVLVTWGAIAEPAETLDRVAAAVGNAAITSSDVEAEYRLELFLKGTSQVPALDAATFERVRNRLLEQKLLAQEAEAGGVDRSGLAEGAKQALDEVRRQYSSEEAYQTSLRALGASEELVLSRLQDQVLTLRLIDQRLRPAAWVERSEIEDYYAKTFLPDFRQKNPGPAPSVDDVEEKIREILVEQKIDKLLSAWLVELKAGRRVRTYSP